MEEKKKHDLSFLSALIIGISVILSCTILVVVFTQYRSAAASSIVATGSASVDFDSDLVVWRGSFTEFGTTSETAYASIKKDKQTVTDYLKKNKISDSDVEFSSVNIEENYNKTYDDYGNEVSSVLNGYDLTQNVTITSKDLDAVEKISTDISSLLASGVQFTSEAPEYYCSTLDDVKLDLIDKATQNAKQRIDIMAKNSGASVGKLRKSSLGVLQVTAKNSGTSDYSYEGYLDTSSRQKTATITVRLDYEVK